MSKSAFPTKAWTSNISCRKSKKAPRSSPFAKVKIARRKLTVLDLFSGAGGTGVGFTKAGFRIIGAIEIDRNAAATYEKNLGVEVEKKDIRKISPAEFRRKLKLRRYELAVLVGCPPCQGFSRMRNSNGADDPRNRLVLKYLDFVKEFMPRFAVFENVPGLVRANHGKKYYDKLCNGLKALGYSIREQEEDAVNYGVAQHRERVIVIAGRNGEAPPFPKPTHGNPNSQEVRNGSRQKWLTVRDAIGRHKYPRLRAGENGEGKNKQYPNHIAPTTGEKVIRFIRRVPKNGGSRRDVPKRYWLKCHRDHDGHADVYGRSAWNRPANTITCGCTNISKGRFVHPTQDRALTPREAAALQSFDENFVFERRNLNEQIGNAVPPLLAFAIAIALRRRIRARAPMRSRRSRALQGTPRTSVVLGGRSNVRSPVASPAQARFRSRRAKAAATRGL